MSNVTSTNAGKYGLMEIIERVPPNLHNEVRKVISQSLSTIRYDAVGLTCATLLGSLLMELRSVKEKKT
jgi:hypothetical protein